MAEFCTECAKELFGKDIDSDFKGILPKEEFKKGQILSVLCEGCGYIYVNHLGERLDEEYLRNLEDE
jgi:hypothetical protein